MCLCVWKDTYFKELAHTVSGVGKSEICKAVGRLETHRRVDVAILSLKTPWRY